MSELHHRAVVSVTVPQGEDAGWFFFVMEYLPRGDLARAVCSAGLSKDRAIRVVLSAAEGLQAAHEAGMIHRDVCPANILIREDETGVVTDFDLVRAIDTTGGTRTSAMGRFVYAAPETMTNAADVGPAADVYSLGMCSLFALLGAEVPTEVLRDQRKVLNSAAASPTVRRVIERAISWESEPRFKTVREFRDAMTTALSATAGTPGRSRRLEQRTVLIVDDEKFIRDIVADFAGMDGAKAFTAASTAEARQILAQHEIDVALIDLKLGPSEPDGSGRSNVAAGLVLLKEIRRLPSAPACIMMSGFATVENAIDVMKAGALNFLVKPFKVEEVVHALAAACEQR
jgi:serine/threonine protein kinase